MMVIKLKKQNYEKIKLKSKKFLNEGKVLVLPTDTVYGLVANAFDEKSVKRIFQIKKRPFNKPLPLFVKDVSEAKKFCEISEREENFLKKVWPGKVTVVLRVKENCPLKKNFFQKEGKIALRVPNYKFLLDLLKEIDFPLTATSANLSGRGSLIDVNKIIREFRKEKLSPDVIIDAGTLSFSKPSTVIDITHGNVKIVRRGAVLKREIAKI